MDARPVEYTIDSLPRDPACSTCGHTAHGPLHCRDTVSDDDDTVLCPCHVPVPGSRP